MSVRVVAWLGKAAASMGWWSLSRKCMAFLAARVRVSPEARREQKVRALNRRTK